MFTDDLSIFFVRRFCRILFACDFLRGKTPAAIAVELLAVVENNFVMLIITGLFDLPISEVAVCLQLIERRRELFFDAGGLVVLMNI